MLELEMDFKVTDYIDVKFEEPIMKIGPLSVFKVPGYLSEDICIAMICENYHSNVPTIYVDHMFMQLRDETKKFVLYHELGHFVNGDLSENNNYRYIDYIIGRIKEFFNKVPEEEQKADLFAYYKLNHSFDKDMSQILEYYNDIQNVVEVNINSMKGVSNKRKDKMIKANKKESERRKQTLLDNIGKGYDFYDPNNP